MLKRAQKARFKCGARSIPDIAFVEFDAVFAQKVAILLLKTTGAMVLFLTLHVLENGIRTHLINRDWCAEFWRVTGKAQRKSIAAALCD